LEKTGFVFIQIAPEIRKEKPAPLEISHLGVGRGGNEVLQSNAKHPTPNRRI